MLALPQARRVRSRATALAAGVVLAIGGVSCGVLSSSNDCTERANCEGDSGFDAAGPGDVGAETGPDLDGADANPEEQDAPVAEDVVDAADGADGPRDALGDADGRAGDAPGDSLPERDVASEDAPIADAPVVDACIEGGVEDCTNGIDDNCDGKIDCADPQCGAYTCAAPVPSTGGWAGPVALWQGAPTATAPACPALYSSPQGGNAGLVAPAATCGNGSCTATGQVCSLPGSFHMDQQCQQNPACASVTPATDGSCTNVPSNVCGTQGSFNLGTTGPTATGGSCVQVPGTVSKAPVSWTNAVQTCAYAGRVDIGGGCPAASQQCVQKPNPSGANPFHTTLCIFTTATPTPATCPAGYASTAAPTVFYTGTPMDTRGCTLPSCGSAPSQGTCSGTIAVFGGGNCSATMATYTLGTSCLMSYNLGANPASVRASYTVTPGSCSVTAQAAPTGTVTPVGPVAVCCM
ncbi:MAG: hypothetical protein JOZ69_10860 [Myxococcales bacterium]|nr:hypothetical protein [Myxococcales bacterium]